MQAAEFADVVHTLSDRRQLAVARGVATATPVFAKRAENAEIWDTEDRRYIDFASGIGVLATGHRHPKVVEAVHRQVDRFTHTAFQVMAYEPYVALAERLNARAPFRGPAKTILLTTGAEAVENAVKIARVATGRPAVIAFTGGFHGRTQLTSALTGKIAPYKRGVSAAVADVFRLPFPNEQLGTDVADTLRALDALFRADVDPARVAAILVEPVQGEGGFHVAPAALLSALRRTCDEYGILLIADEVQSGFGRTGRLFAIEHAGVEPDLVAVAKSLAGGFPLSAVIGRASVIDQVEPGGLGGTYGGSPIGCAAALAVLDVIDEEKLLERADVIGARIRQRVAAFAAGGGYQPIARLRGVGAMLAFDVVSSRGGREPDGAAARRVTRHAFEEGLVVLTCGTFGETVRVLVPLTVQDRVLDEGLDILGRALALAGSPT